MAPMDMDMEKPGTADTLTVDSCSAYSYAAYDTSDAYATTTKTKSLMTFPIQPLHKVSQTPHSAALNTGNLKVSDKTLTCAIVGAPRFNV